MRSGKGRDESINAPCHQVKCIHGVVVNYNSKNKNGKQLLCQVADWHAGRTSGCQVFEVGPHLEHHGIVLREIDTLDVKAKSGYFLACARRMGINTVPPAFLRAYPSSERLLLAAHQERGQGVRRRHGEPCNDDQHSPRF
ncbi:hypothetical protein [Janthinobacterium sp. PSPC3-1]|uniref:hypothetical protein n=1 Tax=Janthinobacterium sp. PSPC3-1 TaxID=2804653 RepID=UPI003CEA3F94